MSGIGNSILPKRSPDPQSVCLYSNDAAKYASLSAETLLRT
jgi:hypothetical protein